MDQTTYTNLSKAWEYVEDHAFTHQAHELSEARTRAQQDGITQGSAAQAHLLALLVRIMNAKSVIAVGTGSVVETLELGRVLDAEGQLTAVDSSAQGITLIRQAFAGLQDNTSTTLRAVHAEASEFLPRLNGEDYDLIVVAGDPNNYTPAFNQAPRLLRERGVIAFTDMLALESNNGGVMNPADRSDKATAMRELLDIVEADDRFDTALTPTGTGLLIAVKR